MAKKEIKGKARRKQKGKCAISGERLPEETELFDTNRKVPKAGGGIYTDQNTEVVDPVVHMAHHNNLRKRDKALEALKAVIDDREQKRKVFMKIQNQLLAYKRRVDHLQPRTAAWLEKQLKGIEAAVKAVDKQLVKKVAELAAVDPLTASALGVKGVGPITLAYCAAYIDLEKAQYPSSLWKYAGLHAASHNRYTKGETSGGNKSLRTALYTMATSQVKVKGEYRQDYDNEKAKLENSKNITKTRNTQGILVDAAWEDTKPSHRHGAALRKVMKLFLVHYWVIGRTFRGLPTERGTYVEDKLGHTGIIRPEERGWSY